VATTVVRGAQIKDSTIQRADLDDGIAAGVTGVAVVRKLIQGTNITLSSTGFDSGTGDVTINATGGGTGDVVGPAGGVSTDQLTTFNTTTGKLINASTASGLVKVASGVVSVITDTSGNWNTAFTNTLDWDGGTTSLVAATGRTSLGLGSAAVRGLWLNASTATQGFLATDTYMTGSNIVIPANAWVAGGQYRCRFEIVKGLVSTAAWSLSIRVGTAGGISDTLIIGGAVATQTAVADTMIVDLCVNIRTIGSAATSAGNLVLTHTAPNGAGYGVATPAYAFALAQQATFNSTTATTIGLSFNGGASHNGNVTTLQASYMQ
jgi:hypothetical protein